MQFLKTSILIIATFIFFESRLISQNFSDTDVTLLMKDSKYRESNQLATSRLNKIPLSTNLKRLFYINKIGLCQFRMGNFDSAYVMGQQALLLTKQTNDSIIISETWQLNAYVYNRLGKFDSAIYFSQKLLNYAIRNKNKKLQGNALSSLSTILMQKGRYREALKYNLDADLIFHTLKDTSLIAVSNFNIGLAYLNLKDIDSSLLYLFKSLAINQGKNGLELKVYTLNSIADCYLRQNNIHLWKIYLLKANEVAEKTDNRQLIAMNFARLGEYANTKNDPKTAYDYMLKARQVLENQPYPIFQMDIDSTLYSISRQLKRNADALKWLESYTSQYKKIFNVNQDEALNKMLVEIESYKNSQIILQKELQLNQAHQKFNTLVFISLILFIIAIGYIVYLYNNATFNKKLFIKNKELDQQVQIVRSSVVLNDFTLPPDSTIENLLTESDENQRSIIIYRRFVELIESEKLYLESDLKIKTLQNRLGTNKKYLYEAISKYSGTNFRGLINRYRVNEVKRIMEEVVNKGETISGNHLVTVSGFNSSTSFYRVFNQQIGLTPNDYINQLKKEKKKHTTKIK